jgi:hypothetical protein
MSEDDYKDLANNIICHSAKKAGFFLSIEDDGEVHFFAGVNGDVDITDELYSFISTLGETIDYVKEIQSIKSQIPSKKL